MNMHSTIDAQETYRIQHARLCKEYDNVQFVQKQMIQCCRQAVQWFKIRVNRAIQRLQGEQAGVGRKVRI